VSAVQSVARRAVQYQNRADQIRREQKQGIKAVRKDRRRVVDHQSRGRAPSESGDDDHEVIAAATGSSDDDGSPTRHMENTPMMPAQRPIIPEGRLTTLLEAEIGCVNLNVDMDPECFRGIALFFNPGCWHHL
jgi:hypothetical protein